MDNVSNLLQDPQPYAASLKATGALIYVVGVTNDTDQNELRSISSPPHEEGVTWWNAPDFEALDSFLQALLKTTCKVCHHSRVPMIM